MIPKHCTPAVGERFKLKNWEAYDKIGVNQWSWLKRLDDVFCGDDPVLMLEVLDGDKPTGRVMVFEAKDVQPPMYWSPVYDIHCEGNDRNTAYKKARNIMKWLMERGGVAVFGSQDLGSAGSMMYGPADTYLEDAAKKPHWSMGRVDIVTDPERITFILAIKTDIPTPREDKAKRKEMLATAKDQYKYGRASEVFNDGSPIWESHYYVYETITLHKG